MSMRSFLKAGHTPTLFAAFFYFDLSFMVWVLLGPLGIAIAKEFHLDPAQKGFMVAVPVLSGALLRLVAGVMVDRIGPKRTGLIGQAIVLAGLGTAWYLGVHNYQQVLVLGTLLGVAGASFAVALPLASRWYPFNLFHPLRHVTHALSEARRSDEAKELVMAAAQRGRTADRLRRER